MDISEQKVLARMQKIRTQNKKSQEEVGIAMDTTGASYSRIENGVTGLTYDHLTKFAKFFKMSAIDVITYDKKFAEISNTDNTVEACLTVKLKEDLKDKVLTLIFGNNNLELLNQ